MSTKSLTAREYQDALDAYTKEGTLVEAARVLGIPRTTCESRIQEAHRRGYTPSKGIEDLNNPAHLKTRLKRLEQELKQARSASLTHSVIRQNIIQLGEQVTTLDIPDWARIPHQKDSLPGVPTLMVSDLHWGEVVDPAQINGVNAYNLEIAYKRMDTLAEAAIHLLRIISPKLNYPGIVVPLGGDMISGNIHDELVATNELGTMPTVLDLYGKLVSFIGLMADTFGHVFLPCVSGNHGRDTTKIWNKDRHHTSFDWLLYGFLAKHFERDDRVTFFIPDGPDAYYRVYEHKYLMTHGDQFRGGDGMIGALGPIIRGDHKKRSRNAQVGMDYDTLLMGHWHQYIHLARLIVNSSLKGYDEYAYAGNFPFEAPAQALWLTHPKYRITYRMPVFVDRTRTAKKTNWVSVVG